MSELHVSEHPVPTTDGWRLLLRRAVSPPHLRQGLRPLLILPGYGMNGFIFGWHPQNRSMERCLCEAGFEVWTGSMRGQRGAVAAGPEAPSPRLRAYAETDIPALVEAVRASTATGTTRVDAIGASLGGSLLYASLVLTPDLPIGAVIAIGAPLRWEVAHPLLRVAFLSRRVARAVPMTGTEAMARRFFPWIARIPGALSIYMNLDHVDLADAAQLTRTVDQPWPGVNQDIASWIRRRDMVLRGEDITAGLARVSRPLLVLLANRDGIVPPETAVAAKLAWGGDDVTVLEVGTDDDWYAHADLFMAPEAPERVFGPMARWLLAREVLPAA